MQENEFEKQVQQKMDELKLIPSDAVWQKIEPQIRKEKRRRFILFVLPIILIGFLYGGYVLLNRSNPINETKQLTKNSIKEKDTIQKTKTGFDSIKNSEAIIENKNPISQNRITKQNAKQKLKTKGKLNMTVIHISDESIVKESPNKKISDTSQKIIDNGSLSSNIKNPEQEKILPVEESKTDTTTILKDETAVDHFTDSIKNIPEKKNENAIDTPHNKTIPPKKHLWNWGFTFSAGRSGMANNLLSSLFGSSQDKSLSSNFSVTPSPVNPVPIPAASLIKSSIAFIVGISVERKINKLTFITGLNYKLFSTTSTTGTDSANYFRATSNVNTYHNYYNYLELPVGIKFQIAHLKKIKLIWSIGSSIAQLIGSNALQFNSTGLYYHDNSLFNKTQFGFNTALDVNLFSNQNREFLVGPYFNYGISKIASQGYNQHHFSFIGLHAQIIFRKK